MYIWSNFKERFKVLAILLSSIKIIHMKQSSIYIKDSTVQTVLSFFTTTLIFFLSLTLNFYGRV
jgi:hypothetical protein